MKRFSLILMLVLAVLLVLPGRAQDVAALDERSGASLATDPDGILSAGPSRNPGGWDARRLQKRSGPFRRCSGKTPIVTLPSLVECDQLLPLT